ncbi:uncharacterized protein LOC105386126 isoform X1 [Plutella xylostella]|uniref:uncharacterized protein LOC105386126 isoform X1 n=1 Tax=Plutella xylostella TaxID=51655 RepID=UPI002032A465|nr:uncharacterized protein LOC105386126 isoform X1 [Plutella xylostella]
MASSDVIELGSSDDEPEPAPKKSKRPLNAMVHIPNKLPGVTIKKSTMIPIVDKSKTVSVKNISKLSSNPVATTVNKNLMKKIISNGQVNANIIKTGTFPKPPNSVVNPLSFLKTINNSQINIKKVMPTSSSAAIQGIKPQNQKCFKNLPPSITITKTNPNAVIIKKSKNIPISISPIKPSNANSVIIKKRKNPISVLPVKQLQKKMKLSHSATQREILTVELDDDEASQSSNSPQWYLKPEDHKSLEEQNNTEPETTKMVEITIEDSPIKPPPNKRTCEVGKEFAITIEDSPVKLPQENNINNDATASGSDTEQPVNSSTPNSKKKLQYPKETQNEKDDDPLLNTNVTLVEPHTIEIEVEPFQSNTVEDATKIDNTSTTKQNNDIVEIEESPVKRVEELGKKTTPVKVVPKTSTIHKPMKSLEESREKELGEFNPIYQSFIDLCLKLEDSDDMNKIVEKKIKTYYRQVPKEYTDSEEFLEMVSSKIMAMKAGPDKMYLYIKDIVDELNLQRKIAKSKAIENEKRKEMEAAAFYEDLEVDTKRKRQVRKLEKTLKKLNRAIHKLEEQEVDFDDDGDSVYILTESSEEDSPNDKDKSKPVGREQILKRYKERLVRVHAKLCQLSNTKMPSEPRLHLEPRPGRPAGPARRLEKWINRKVPVGTPLPFPDFHDVLRCVREANQEDKLDWNEADIMEEARDLFTRCGKKLQRRRQENEWRIAASRINAEVDPVEESEDLKKKLENNRNLAAQKESELINKYADRQKQLQLEAVEIGDKEAEESPVESGDDAQDEAKEETTLETTEDRKERIRRLLKDKSKTSTDLNKTGADSKDTSKSIEQNEKKTDRNEDESTDNKLDESLDHKVTDTTPNAEKRVTVALVSESMEVEICAQEKGDEGKKYDSTESVHLLSDDSKKVDSDMDELHLLEKLHEGAGVASSTLESSDSDTPIAISDTLESSDEIENRQIKNCSDVVSIENSSYSESETSKDVEGAFVDGKNTNLDENEAGQVADSIEDTDSHAAMLPESDDENKTNNADPLMMDICDDDNISNIDAEMQENIDQPKKKNRNSNEEYSEPVEDILLASSDESNEGKSNEVISSDSNGDSRGGNNYVNLKDDSISIGDTVVEENKQRSQCHSETPITIDTDSANTADESQDKCDDAEHSNSVDIDTKADKDVVELNSGSSGDNVTEEEQDTVPIADKPADISVDSATKKDTNGNNSVETEELTAASKDVGDQSPKIEDLERELHSIYNPSESTEKTHDP